MAMIQAKLSIGEPNDKYEQEAYATASKVVQQINSPTQDQSVQREAMEEDEELQMKSLVQRRENLGGGEASTDLESSIQSARGSGQSLDSSLQTKMGQAMGADFSGVKVHTDSQSDQLNKSIQAKAFTTGQDVFFRQGAYEPSSRGGQELIAHELTHVLQQNGGAVQRVSKAIESAHIESANASQSIQRLRDQQDKDSWEFEEQSNSGGIALVNPQELYATLVLIETANKALASKNSFVQFKAGKVFPETDLMQVIPVRNESVKPRKGSPQEEPYNANSTNLEERSQQRFKTTYNSERIEPAVYSEEATEEEVSEAHKAHAERVNAEIKQTIGDYVTFADCCYNTMYAMGGEDVSPLDPSNIDERKALPNAQKQTGLKARNVNPGGAADPAAIGAISWLMKVIPFFGDVLRATGNQAVIATANTLDSSPIKGKTLNTVENNMDYPKELWRLYNTIMDDPAARLILANKYKVNEGLGTPQIGEGISAINNPYEKLVGDAEAEKRDKNDPEFKDAKDKWNFHWVPVVMVDGPDYVLLENAAGDDVNRLNIDTYRWRFRLLGPSNSFEDVTQDDPHTTKHHLTLPFAKATK
ncbi:MAG: hypothetical protein DCF20_18080 [Pseudanabaena sp.]|nr:MAG: hypothetical protein DCF20_18080 [Pseudanabaena sp.]